MTPQPALAIASGTKPLSFIDGEPSAAGRAQHMGFRFGDRGTHTSRTMMLEELRALLANAPELARRADYAIAIIEENALGKTTTATRRLSNQRLGELYGLDPSIALFRVLRPLWNLDPAGRPLLALLVAIARDPLLAASAAAIVPLPISGEYNRDAMRSALRRTVGDRLNDDTLNKVARNVASSWTQSGHLTGRTFKRRARVAATPASVAFALYLGQAAGLRGDALFASGWLQVLDCTPTAARVLALEAKRQGLIDLRMAGDVIVLDVERLDPYAKRR